jgi:transcriptional regulator of aromatic amino acid metabolism
MTIQRRSLDDFQVHKVVSLLVRTDMSLGEIAQRMGCSHTVIAGINRQYQVRDYAGQRTRWTVNEGEQTEKSA